MPYRRSFRSRRPVRRYGRRYRRRTYKPWRARRRFRTSIRRSVLRRPKNHLPKAKRVRLRICHQNAIDPTAGNLVYLTYNLTSAYDPYPSGTQQPMGFDQWMALYQYFTVIKTTYQVRLTSVQTVSSLWGIHLSRSNVLAPTSASTLIEQQGTVWRSVLGNQNERNQDIKGSVSAKKWLNSEWTSPDRVGTDAGDPEDNVYMHVWMVPADALSDPSATRFMVILDMDVLFHDPKKQPQS